MNKKGFTLIELLAVIVILSLLALLASNTITSLVRNSKKELYDTQIKLIEAAAESWATDNLDLLPDVGSCKYMNLSYLQAYGIIDSDITNPKTNQPFNSGLLIKITTEENGVGLNNIEYEVNPESVEGCESIYSFCSLIDDIGEKGITPGDKYQCKVKDDMETGFENGYYFFVLGTNEDGTTNLIMERNIYYDSTNNVGLVATSTNTGLVAWYSSSDTNEFGPVTAMDYLYNATKDWNNIPNMVINYTDEGNDGSNGYGTIITTNNVTKITKKDNTAVTVLTDKEGYINLKARMPKESEISSYDSTTKTNAYLYDYLSSYNSIQTTPISGIYGYWTLSSYASTSHQARYVFYIGELDSNGNFNVNYSSDCGVRPVITLEI